MSFFIPSYNLTPEQNARLRRASVWAGSAIVLAVLLLLAYQAGGSSDADKPFWEMVIYARLYLIRTLGAVGATVLVSGLSVVEWAALDNTRFAQRLWVWADGDTDQIKADKKRNAATVLAALVVANALLFSQVVR